MAETARHLLAHFLDTTPDETNATYDRIGEGVSDMSMNYNPNSTTEQYIHEASATTSVTNYAPTMPVTQVVFPGDDVYDFIDAIRQAGPSIGVNDLTTLVEVRLYEPADTGGTTYPATLWSVQIQIDTIGGPGNANAGIGWTINVQGDPTDGDFDTSDNTFTATTP